MVKENSESSEMEEASAQICNQAKSITSKNDQTIASKHAISYRGNLKKHARFKEAEMAVKQGSDRKMPGQNVSGIVTGGNNANIGDRTNAVGEKSRDKTIARGQNNTIVSDLGNEVGKESREKKNQKDCKGKPGAVNTDISQLVRIKTRGKNQDVKCKSINQEMKKYNGSVPSSESTATLCLDNEEAGRTLSAKALASASGSIYPTAWRHLQNDFISSYTNYLAPGSGSSISPSGEYTRFNYMDSFTLRIHPQVQSHQLPQHHPSVVPRHTETTYSSLLLHPLNSSQVAPLHRSIVSSSAFRRPQTTAELGCLLNFAQFHQSNNFVTSEEWLLQQKYIDNEKNKEERRKNQKNARSRERAATYRAYIASIEAKTHEERTPEEKYTVKDYEDKRKQKNQGSRKRALQKKKEINRVLNIPESARTREEKDFLDIILGQKRRKVEGDRLRRKRMKLLELEEKAFEGSSWMTPRGPIPTKLQDIALSKETEPM
jgi:hypothetical protein